MQAGSSLFLHGSVLTWGRRQAGSPEPRNLGGLRAAISPPSSIPSSLEFAWALMDTPWVWE